MWIHSGSRSRFEFLAKNPRTALVAALAASCLAVLVTAPTGAASIPAWLDEGITKWNESNPASPIRFVDIKDSYVWYDMTKSAELGHKQIRTRINDIVLGHGYEPMDDEEKVTMGKPPAMGGRVSPKKCWSRSFVLNIQAQSDTRAVGDERAGQRQRMLTSLVCEDTTNWWAAFRVAD